MSNGTDIGVATPIEPTNRCSNSTEQGTLKGYFLVCDFSTNTVQLLIQSPVQGDVYYCKGATTESQRTTVSVAGMYVWFINTQTILKGAWFWLICMLIIHHQCLSCGICHGRCLSVSFHIFSSPKPKNIVSYCHSAPSQWHIAHKPQILCLGHNSSLPCWILIILHTIKCCSWPKGEMSRDMDLTCLGICYCDGRMYVGCI